MSMYNALFGTNPFAGIWLTMLGLKPGDTGRFRDCYLVAEKDKDGKVDADQLEIHIYTRNGGGNRPDYQDVLAKLAEHPCYIRDEDDDFDCTYCTISFKVPEEVRHIVKQFTEMNWEVLGVSPKEKWIQLFEDMEKGKDTPVVKNALEVGTQIFAKIEEAFNEQREGNDKGTAADS